MGIRCGGASRSTNMKAFIVLFACIVAAMAEADADAQYLAYGHYPAATYGLHHPYHAAYAALPYAAAYHVPAVYAKPCTNDAGAVVPCAHGAVASVHIAKREAEADSDPAYFAVPHAYGVGPYGYGFGYGHSLVHTSHFGVCTNYLGAQVPC